MNTQAHTLARHDSRQAQAERFEAVDGPSFPAFVKALATALMLALAWVGTAAMLDPAADGPVAGNRAFLLAIFAVVAASYWGVMTSRTRFDGTCIEQTWLWHKKVAIAEISQVKLVHVPGLAWLVVPRLVVRTGFGLTTFHTGDAAVLARFRLLAHGA